VAPVAPVLPVAPVTPVAPVYPVYPVAPCPNEIPFDQSPDAFVFFMYKIPFVVSKNANPAGSSS
jgi:hypothetical protein